MTDIVERLRHRRAAVPDDNSLCDEAADEIERLRAKVYEKERFERWIRADIDETEFGDGSDPQSGA